MSEARSHPNLDVVNAVYQAMADGDRARLEDLHHPDVVLHVSGQGDHVGRDAVLGRGAAAGEAPAVTTEVHDVLWSPEHVVVLLSVEVTRDGETHRQPIVQVVHVSQGQVTEIWEYLWNPQDDEIFWSRH